MERMEPVRNALVSTKKEEFEEITLGNIMKRLKHRNDFNRVIDSRRKDGFPAPVEIGHSIARDLKEPGRERCAT